AEVRLSLGDGTQLAVSLAEGEPDRRLDLRLFGEGLIAVHPLGRLVEELPDRDPFGDRVRFRRGLAEQVVEEETVELRGDGRFAPGTVPLRARFFVRVGQQP